MMRGSSPRRAVVDLPRAGPDEIEEGLRRSCWHRWMDREGNETLGNQNDRVEALQWVVGYALEQSDVLSEGRGRHQQGVAVGCRPRDRLRPNVPAGPGLVLDDDGLAPAL